MQLDAPLPLGFVPLDGRGGLPFALVNGESLVACASWALSEAEVELFDFNVPWDLVRDSGRPLVVHDPLCPLTPPAFIAQVVETAAATDRLSVAFHPVTDTVRVGQAESEGVLGADLPREESRQVASPVVIPARLLGALGQGAAGDLADLTADLAHLVAAVASQHLDETIEWVQAPPLARRVADGDDIRLLEAQSVVDDALIDRFS